jgi:hypothetical protein
LVQIQPLQKFMRGSLNGKAHGFQPGDQGSIPCLRSLFRPVLLWLLRKTESPYQMYWCHRAKDAEATLATCRASLAVHQAEMNRLKYERDDALDALCSLREISGKG